MGLLAAGSLMAAEIEVSLRVVGDASPEDPVEIIVVAIPVEGDASDAVENPPVSVGGWFIDLPTEGPWRLQAQAPGYWGETVGVARVATGEAIELRLWPAGVLRGGLATTGGEILPSVLQLGFEGDEVTWGDGEMPPASTVDCPVEGERWRCEVPAGSFNLTLAAGLYVSQRRWEVLVEPARVHDLGVFDLELGGAIAGKVELDDVGVPGPDCEVRIAGAGGGDRRRDVLSVPLAEDGSFEVQAIPARQYVVNAAQQGYFPANSGLVRIEAGERLVLPEPLMLRRPASLEVVFAPRIGPDGRGWRFVVSRLDETNGRQVVHSTPGQSGEDGKWLAENLKPGSYQIGMQEAIQNRRGPQRVTLEGGLTTTVNIELPVLLVEGQVLLYGEPLAARVT
ncbi:MAG: hypothetical protein HKN80_09130, partial [Acidimicrobiia bacterium]|nr:hypothetical protein [Acidimicrobiia bacterium]